VDGPILRCDRSGKCYAVLFGYDFGDGGLVTTFEVPAGIDPTAGLGDVRVAYGYGPGDSVRALEALVTRGGDYAPRAAAGGRVLLSSVWDLIAHPTFGSITFGRTRSGYAFTPLGLTGAANAKVLGAAAVRFARAFPVPLTGLWATGTWLPENAHRTEAVVRHAEGQLARAHGLTIAAVRARLRSEVGAIAKRSADRVDWHFFRRSSEGTPFVMPVEHYWPESLVARAPFAMRLASKSVVIIGCGAVGWSVATLLARSGVCSFTLFDNDHLRSGNLPRVGAFLDASGRLKVEALAEQLEAIAPGIEVRVRAADVGQQVGTTALVDAQPDLLINLTGEEMSTDETNLAALILDRPALFAWVSMGVIAGRIVRVRPGESACYECVREAAPNEIPSLGGTPVDAAIPWPGSVLDTTAFAAAVARSAVLTLIGEPVSTTNPDHVVLNFSGLAPTTRSIEITRDPRCSRCGS
jgi:molybdopterin/thiamine biosynthesis adenylyltransferase